MIKVRMDFQVEPVDGMWFACVRKEGATWTTASIKTDTDTLPPGDDGNQKASCEFEMAEGGPKEVVTVALLKPGESIWMASLISTLVVLVAVPWLCGLYEFETREKLKSKRSESSARTDSWANATGPCCAKRWSGLGVHSGLEFARNPGG
eukprot:g29031.t1